MGNNSINDAFKELESMSNQIKNKKQAQSQNANYDQYNELDSFNRERNERAADPSVFFNNTGNPFLGIMHFLQRKPVPPKPIDEQRLLESFSKCAKKQRNFKKMLRLIVVIIPVSVILSMLIGGVIGVILNFLPFIMVPVLIIYLIMNSVKGYNNSDYTINDYKAYVIKKAIEGQVEGLVYEPRFGLPESVYSDLNVMRHGNRYHKEDLITGKYKNVYFVQSDLKVQYESNGEHDTTTTYFRGRWIAIDYPKKFNGTVVIIDNSFAYGVKRKELEKIQLENPNFNNMFTVRASDMQLGYYLLTPQLVEKIMELKQSTNGNIVACFKNGYLHIFINDGKDSFEPNINNVNLMGDIQKFMQDFTLVSGTIDVLDINNSVYAQGNAQPPMQAPYQNYSNSTSPNNNNSSGIGIQGGRF
ncbi:DUF3137 domain-containing protein [Pseudoruminococcus massiliensis]|uniref:DUF3137 domain-containing protein n=1 Tax=Pseudoruminococcus massiliensis TaxID=2086583 RepID=UPI0022E091E8|nr:DUF3137 domain-containing protein [Pseudoruminococcus massiliensis]